ncbi:MAG: hypothetical protein JW959_03835 [Pirellulales bacterium]|nr:hypothetical protein [Pirellulales bacterium]
MLLGALAGEGLYLWAVAADVLTGTTASLILMPLVGAVIGISVHKDFEELRNIIRAGCLRQVLLWTLWGAVVGGGLGLAIKYWGPPHSLGNFEFLVGGSVFSVLLFWGGFGGLLAMLGASNYITPQKNNDRRS